MADKLFKINEDIEIGYQAPNAETGLTGSTAVVAEIYLPGKIKDSSFPDVELVEIAGTGIYRGEFTPNVEGTWQVITHKSDDSGQVVKAYSVGAHNVDSVGTAVGTVDTKVVGVADQITTVNTDMAKDATVAKASALTIIETKVDGIVSAVNAIDTPPMAF